MSIRRLSHVALLLAGLACAAPSLAQPGWGYRGDGWRGDDGRASAPSSSRDSREGKVDTEQFRADDVGDQLGHGPIEVTQQPGTTSDAGDTAIYEAAVVDQLVKAGYDTIKPDPQGGQIAEIRIVRDVLLPEEGKRKPVSGAMTVGAGNRGSMVGMAVAIDLTKPKKALLSTRLEARVKDRATGKPLWEGRAEIATREGDSHWGEQAIATRLAAALFENFRSGDGEKGGSP